MEFKNRRCSEWSETHFGFGIFEICLNILKFRKKAASSTVHFGSNNFFNLDDFFRMNLYQAKSATISFLVMVVVVVGGGGGGEGSRLQKSKLLKMA